MKGITLIEQPPEWFRKLFPGALFRLPESGLSPGVVYLTFDDGPIPEVTPWVLDILDQFDVKATFFMVGENIRRHPELLQEVVNRGHKAANHTLHHIRGLGISPEDYIKDVEECERHIGTGLVRPPHGWLSPAQFKALKKDYEVVMYDVVTRDYSKRVKAAEILENVKKLTRNGSIIVFHDSLKSYEKIKKALPESLQWLKSQGYKFSLL